MARSKRERSEASQRTRNLEKQGVATASLTFAIVREGGFWPLAYVAKTHM